MTLLNKAFAEVMYEGDAAGSLFSFPIPTYNITPDFDWENPDYDGIWQMTAKYGIPYFSNFVNSDMKPDDVRSIVLPAAARQTGTNQARRRTVRVEPADRVGRRRDDQPAATRLRIGVREVVFSNGCAT